MALAAPLLNSSGIYAIENTVNGKRYVGSALSFRRRWRLHRRMLEAGRAPRKFQNAWNKYGPDKFEFRVLLICSRADLLFFENRAIASCDAVAHGYNSRHQAESNLGIRFGPPSESTRAKISAAQKGRPGNGGWPKGVARPKEMNKKQSLSRRNLFKKYQFGDKNMCLSDWADHIGISLRGLQNRIARGWPLERALTEASRGY